MWHPPSFSPRAGGKPRLAVTAQSIPPAAGRFGNDNNIALDQVSKCNLSGSLAVPVAYFGQYRMTKNIVLSCGKRTPRFHAGTMLFHDILQLALGVKYMGLYLIDCGDNPAGAEKLFKAICPKI